MTAGMTKCSRCDTELSPDRANLDTDYQFDNVLWIGFHGGYGMFVDNVEAKWPNNTDERWIRRSDERDEYGMYCDFLLGDTCRCEIQDITVDWRDHQLSCPARNPVDDPEWKPTYTEERVLPAQPDYEAVLCHDCAHELCDREPWLGRILRPFGSHAHKIEYMERNPEHWGWDNTDERDEAGMPIPPTWLPEHLR